MRQIRWADSLLNRIYAAILIGVLLHSGTAVSFTNTGDSVDVESKTVCTNDEDIEIRVRFANELEVRHISVPLEFRTVSGGAYIQSVKLSWDERLPYGKTEPLGEFAMTHHYDHKGCACSKGQSRGYGTILVSDTLSHSVEVSPYAVMFTRLRLMRANLPPGRDSVGSMVLTLSVNEHAGSFEIDTTCVCPANHLVFVVQSGGPKGVSPSFTKGVVTVSDCASDSL